VADAARPRRRAVTLADHLARLIALEGPITVARFMGEALLHPRHGYYQGRDPFGAAGDFVTAPEISQIFGELIGLWCAELWRLMGEPAALRLVELGPGRGTLMADALRAARLVPRFRNALSIHLVEASASLRARQQAVLAGTGASWHERFAEVPPGPLVLVANEFFDALPVRQFVKQADGWHERLVDRDPAGGLRFVLARDRLPEGDLLPAMSAVAPPGSVIEVSPARSALAGEIAARLAAEGGAALLVDYGPAASGIGDSLQAVRGHRRHDVLAEPGSADLTAHVDFQALAEAARGAGARAFGPLAQGDFLRRLGIERRAAALRARASPAQACDIDAALARLTDAAAMGTLFKALAIAAPALPPPPGFDDADSPKP
jgi:NADH dehydrogenase [ubiquinone] 1 alpha subcomplex assembly factor 7